LDEPVTHVVKRGDTVSSIADQYGASVAAVLSANGLGSRDTIYPGQRLRVPAGSGSGGTRGTVVHTVRKGETVTSIARKYGTSIESVLRANGLSSRDKIYPGQTLKVPVGATRS
jgi:LysM repeat protein